MGGGEYVCPPRTVRYSDIPGGTETRWTVARILSVSLTEGEWDLLDYLYRSEGAESRGMLLRDLLLELAMKRNIPHHLMDAVRVQRSCRRTRRNADLCALMGPRQRRRTG